ncbi:hypothetical protein BJY52DRAFT_1368128 [Lactarius psammicola]|nr:hypothetical protein BJY52DRAFT_1368128 [Lactarius psammicola]
MSTYQQGEYPTIQNCSCARCSDERRTRAGPSTWNPVGQQGHFGIAITPYLNQGQNVDSRAETTMIAPNHAQAQFAPSQFSGIQDEFGYAPVPERAGPPNVGLLQAPILNASIAEGRRRLAARYLNNPDAYVHLVNSKSSSCLNWPTSSEAASKGSKEPNKFPPYEKFRVLCEYLRVSTTCQLVNVGSKPGSIHRCGKKQEYMSNDIAIGLMMLRALSQNWAWDHHPTIGPLTGSISYSSDAITKSLRQWTTLAGKIRTHGQYPHWELELERLNPKGAEVLGAIEEVLAAQSPPCNSNDLTGNW